MYFWWSELHLPEEVQRVIRIIKTLFLDWESICRLKNEGMRIIGPCRPYWSPEWWFPLCWSKADRRQRSPRLLSQTQRSSCSSFPQQVAKELWSKGQGYLLDYCWRILFLRMLQSPSRSPAPSSFRLDQKRVHNHRWGGWNHIKGSGWWPEGRGQRKLWVFWTYFRNYIRTLSLRFL